MKGKIIVPLILASVSATMLASQNYTVNAAYDESTSMFGDMITVSSFTGEGHVGVAMSLPVASATGGAALKVTILDPRGEKIVDMADATTVTTLTPTLKGYYTVKYSAVQDSFVTTATEELKILVEGEDYSISLPVNSQHVIPATVATGTAIKIPLPTVKQGNNELTEAQLTNPVDATNNGLKVTVVNKDNASSATALTYDATTKTYSFTPTTAGVYEIIYRYLNGGTVQDYKTDGFVAKTNYDTSKMKLNFTYKSSVPTTATLGKKVALPGVKVVDSNGTTDELDAYVDIKVKHVAANGTQTDVAVNDYSFVPTQKGSYLVTYKASIPLFGKESSTLSFYIHDVKDNEKPTVKPVNQYTYETVEGKTTIKTVYEDVNGNGQYDSATEKELYNSTSAEAVAMTEEERKTAIEEAMGSIEHSIPSVVVLKNVGGEHKATIKVPAIYGTDNFYDFSDLTFSRAVRVVSSNTTITLRKADGSEYSNNEYAEHTFTSVGEYTIRYTAQDKDGNQYVTSYPVKVVNEADAMESSELIKPTIEFAALANSVDANGVLTFAKPTATDKLDTRPETAVYYSFEADSYDAKDKVRTTNDDGKLVLDLNDISVGANTTLYLHAVAKNDYNPVVSTIVRSVAIIGTNDNTAATFETSNSQILTNLAIANASILEDKLPEGTTIDADSGQLSNGQNAVSETGMLGVQVNGLDRAAFSQKDVVTLPDIEISDADPYLTVNVKVRAPHGKVVTLKNISDVVTYDAGVYTHKLTKGTFTADYSGIYTVTYTAKDSGGNIITKSFGIRIYDTEKPTINLSSTDVISGTAEVGKFIEVPAATLKDNGVILTDITTNVPYESRTTGKAGTYWDIIEAPSINRRGTVGFTPDIAGTYIIRYTGWDKNGNLTESKTYTITASDTIKPTITLEKDYILNENQAWVTGGVEIVAPGIGSIYDGYRDVENKNNNYDQTPIEDITLNVKVTDVDGKTIANEAVSQPKYTGSSETTTRYKFTANKQGVYTITYTATDATGNTYELTKQVKVGDCENPDVAWVNSDEDLISTANLNSTYDFNLDMITIDGVKGSSAIEIPANETKGDYTVTVNLYNSASSVVANEYKDRNDNTYRWKFEESGTYELRIVVTDKAGNKTTKSYNIVVASEEANTSKVSPVVGTILIVISSLILVGVVAYFIISGRKKANQKGSRKSRR